MISRIKNFFKRAAAQRGYDGAKSSRLNADWFAGSRTSAVQELTPDVLDRLRARGRDLERNSDTVRAWLALLSSNVIGEGGLRAQVRVREADGSLSDARGNAVEAAWQEWGRGMADAAGVLSWRAVQDMVLRRCAVDGGALLRLVRGADNAHRFAVQVLDADLLDARFNRVAGAGASAVTQGIAHDEWGRALGYYLQGAKGREFLSARELLYIKRPERPGQLHCAPWLASCLSTLKMLDGYREAELVAARVGASSMGIVTRAASGDGFPSAPGADGAGQAEIAPGSILHLPEGASWQTYDPSGHPAGAFPDFTKAMLRSVAGALGVSYNALAQDLEGVSYSSLRSGALAERDQYRVCQGWLAHALAVPVFNAWLEMAALANAVALADGVEHEHRGRSWPWVDPLKDTNAQILAIGAGLKSRRQVIAEAGGDAAQTLAEIAADNAAASAAGVFYSTGEMGGDDEGED